MCGYKNTKGTETWEETNSNIVLGVFEMLVPVVARSKAYVYGRWPVEIVGSNPTGGMDVCLLCVVT